LDVDDGAVRAVPFRKSSIRTSWNISKHGFGNNLKECVVRFLEVRFELALNIDDERGRDGREQTGLFPTLD